MAKEISKGISSQPTERLRCCLVAK